jgi:hypothetical protein
MAVNEKDLPKERRERESWVRTQLDRWTPFWIMVAGVCAVVGVVLTLVLVSEADHPPPGPTPVPTTPVPTTPVPNTPVPNTTVTTTPPTLAYNFNFDGSSQYPCSDEGTIHSVVNGPSDSFNFVNESATYLQIIWLNDSGNRIIEDTLAPGGTYSGSFYVGDAWLIASPNAVCQGIFVIDSVGEVTTTSSS